MSYNSIFFGVIDPVAIEAEIVAQYVQQTGITPNPGDPEFQINATIAYARVLTLQAIERAGKANIVQFATGSNLDYIGGLIGLQRIQTQASVTRLSFNLTPGHAQVVIPGGTLVSSADGIGVYETNEDTIVSVGQNSVTIDATCTTDGTATNGYAIGTINIIQNPQPYLQGATNLDVTSGGADLESDQSFRDRWFSALEALSVAGPKGAYKFHALSASNTIISASVLGPEDGGVNPGTVEIRILTNTGVPTQSILDAVLAACNGDTVRPTCDTVLVFGANQINYNLVVGITAFAGSNTLALPGLVQAAIQAYCSQQGTNIGTDVVADAIIQAGMLAGVKRLDLGGFIDIPVDLRSFAQLGSISVTVTGVEAP